MENETSENLLQLVNTKMGLQSFKYAAMTSLENMMEKLLMDPTSQKTDHFVVIIKSQAIGYFRPQRMFQLQRKGLCS